MLAKSLVLATGRKRTRPKRAEEILGGGAGRGDFIVQNIGKTNTISGMRDLRSNNTVVLVGDGRSKHKRV